MIRHPFEKVCVSGAGLKPGSTVKMELEGASYGSLFSPIGNGFARPYVKLVGGAYPKHPAQEGGVTYGFGFHCHNDMMGCFTPVPRSEPSSAVLRLEVFAPEELGDLRVKTRGGGNDDDAFPSGQGKGEEHSLGRLAKGPSELEIKLKAFDNDIAFKIVTAQDETLYVKSVKAIPVYEAKAGLDGAWRIDFSLPFPYGFKARDYVCSASSDGKTIKRESFKVRREDAKPCGTPADAACQWLLNRFAKPELDAKRGAFPLFYYDPFAKTFYGNGHTIWIRPYPVMSLAELAARREVAKEILEGVAKYVKANHFLDGFHPERRSGYLEYCGTGNYFYGACATLLHVCEDPELKRMLASFVGKYMDSQKAYTKMTAFDAVCHRKAGKGMATITACGHEETMHAAVVEAYRQSRDPELLHEAIGERGVGFLEGRLNEAMIVPERLKSLPGARDLYGYYGSMHMPWARGRDAIHYRAEGLLRLFETTGEEKWIELASRRTSNFLRYVGGFVGDEFLDINFEYPASLASQAQGDDSVNTSTGGTDGEYYQDIYTAAGIQSRFPTDMYLREKLRRSMMLVAATTRMNASDPESFGEAWIPHYAWDEDYERKSAGSRVISVWIAPGTFMRAESAGFGFSPDASYQGPLSGLRKLFDSASVPEEAFFKSQEIFFETPDGKPAVSSLEIRNLSSKKELRLKRVSINGEVRAENLKTKPGTSVSIDIAGVARPGEQNSLALELEGGSTPRMLVMHKLECSGCKLFATAMDESFGGRFVRRSVVLDNQWTAAAEKSWHKPGDPDSYYRKLPADEGFETVGEASYLKTWKPFMELACKASFRREAEPDGSTTISFSSENGGELRILDELWTDADGKTLNGAKVTEKWTSFKSPRAKAVAKAWKNGELDPLHSECSLPLEVSQGDGFLTARLINYPGAAKFTVEIFSDGKIELAIPKRSDSTSLSFNGETVYKSGSLKTPNAFRIESAKEDAAQIRLLMRWKGRIDVAISSDAEAPGAPAGLCAARIDPSGISSKAVRLRWQPNLEKTCGFWNVYRAYGEESEMKFVGWSPEPVFTDFSADAGLKPRYKVQAVAKDGTEGGLSEEATLP